MSARSGTNVRQRTSLVAVRATPEELALVKAAAGNAGLAVAEYVRALVITPLVTTQNPEGAA
jgi:hypothetical protein